MSTQMIVQTAGDTDEAFADAQNAHRTWWPALPERYYECVIESGKIDDFAQQGANAGKKAINYRIKVTEAGEGKNRVFFLRIPLFQRFAPKAENPKGAVASDYFSFFALMGLSPEQVKAGQIGAVEDYYGRPLSVEIVPQAVRPGKNLDENGVAQPESGPERFKASNGGVAYVAPAVDSGTAAAWGAPAATAPPAATQAAWGHPAPAAAPVAQQAPPAPPAPAAASPWAQPAAPVQQAAPVAPVAPAALPTAQWQQPAAPAAPAAAQAAPVYAPPAAAQAAPVYQPQPVAGAAPWAPAAADIAHAQQLAPAQGL